VIKVALILFQLSPICSGIRGHAYVCTPICCAEGFNCQPFLSAHSFDSCELTKQYFLFFSHSETTELGYSNPMVTVSSLLKNTKEALTLLNNTRKSHITRLNNTRLFTILAQEPPSLLEKNIQLRLKEGLLIDLCLLPSFSPTPI